MEQPLIVPATVAHIVKCPYCDQPQRIKVALIGHTTPFVYCCETEDVPGCDRYFVVQTHVKVSATTHGIDAY